MVVYARSKITHCDCRISGSTSVDEARNALGKRLRELRQQAGLTGKQFAESLTWPASTVSMLEIGRQTPTDQDIP
jgi:DNA-binding transcriptional regulator YiaG